MNSERDSAHAAPAALGAFCIDNGFWRCQRCGKLLGEIWGDELVVRHGRLQMRVSLPIERTCERCGKVNCLSAERR